MISGHSADHRDCPREESSRWNECIRESASFANGRLARRRGVRPPPNGGTDNAARRRFQPMRRASLRGRPHGGRMTWNGPPVNRYFFRPSRSSRRTFARPSNSSSAFATPTLQLRLPRALRPIRFGKCPDRFSVRGARESAEGETRPQESPPELAEASVGLRDGRAGTTSPEAETRRGSATPDACRGQIPGGLVFRKQGSYPDQIAVPEVAEMPKEPVRHPLAVLP